MTRQNLAAPWFCGELLNDFTPERAFILTGGLGSGKTHSAVLKHHRLCIINRKSPFSGFFEPVYSKIRDAAIPTYRKVLTQLGYKEHRDFSITVSAPYPTLTYHASGHQVHFRSAENPDLIVAVEYSHATGDEMSVYKEDAYTNIRSRIRCSLAKCRQFVGTITPLLLKSLDWSERFFDSEVLDGWDRSADRDHLQRKENLRRFICWTDDNDFVPKSYLRLLERIYPNPNLLKALRFGRFSSSLVGNVYANYMPVRHDIEDIAPDPHLDINLTFDFNANPMAWVGLQRFRFQDFDARGERNYHNSVAVHEANEGHSQTDDAVIEFSEKFPVLFFSSTPIFIYGDRSGHSQSHKIKGTDYDQIRRYLRDLGYRNVNVRAAKSNPLQHESSAALDRLFLNNLLKICKRCTSLRRSLVSTKWKKGTKDIDKPPGETHTHHSDAMKYWAHTATRGETLNPQDLLMGY